MTRQSDLAKVIGCYPKQISRWESLASPPKLRKGFGRALAYALQTTPWMLATGWSKTDPVEAERELFDIDQFPLSVGKECPLSDEEILLHSIIRKLLPSECESLLLAAAKTVLARRDDPLFRKILSRFKLFEDGGILPAGTTHVPLIDSCKTAPTPNHLDSLTTMGFHLSNDEARYDRIAPILQRYIEGDRSLSGEQKRMWYRYLDDWHNMIKLAGGKRESGAGERSMSDMRQGNQGTPGATSK